MFQISNDDNKVLKRFTTVSDASTYLATLGYEYHYDVEDGCELWIDYRQNVRYLVTVE